MIKSFGSAVTEGIWNGERSSRLPLQIQEIARRKLRILNNSQDLKDIIVPPSNRLEKLSGKLKEYYSIRVNKRWRIISNGNPGMLLMFR